MNQFFMKEAVEKEALIKLQEYDSEKYQNAELSDRPDIKNKELSIGVEVTVVEFEDIILSTKTVGKSLIEYLKMFGQPSARKMNLNYLVHLSGNDDSIEEFLSLIPVYADSRGHPVFIKDILQLNHLPDNTKIYFPDKSLLRTLNSEGKVQFPPFSAQWVGALPKKMMNKLKEKERKIEGYEVFEEMNLYIKCFSGDIEEIREFEDLVRKYNSGCKCKFNRIYVTEYWSENKLYEIVL